jgi:SAM-dependent methyltransferase
MRGFRSDSYGDAFADVYDEWYADVTDLDATVAFVAALAGPDGSVLELGVGTGRLAVPIAARAGRVVGVDTSRRMLEELARSDVDRTVTTVHGDMVDDLPDGPFDVVLAAYNTVFNLTSAERQQACFDQVAARLAPGGRFVVEAFVPDTADGGDGGGGGGSTSPRGSRVTVRSMSVDAVVLSASVHDTAAQVAEGQFIEISEAGGVRLRPWSIRWADPAELDAMATKSGLVRSERWADYDRSPFDASSARHVTVYSLPTRGTDVASGTVDASGAAAGLGNAAQVRTSLGQSL